jgi:hypothetical protein
MAQQFAQRLARRDFGGNPGFHIGKGQRAILPQAIKSRGLGRESGLNWCSYRSKQDILSGPEQNYHYRACLISHLQRVL